MQNVTDKFKNAVKYSHTPVVKLFAHQSNSNTELTVVGGGGLIMNYDDATRSSLDIEFVDPLGRTIKEMRDLLKPRTTLYEYQRGIHYADGTEELVGCGFFYATSVKMKTSKNVGPIFIVQAYDASIRMQTGLTTPYYIAPGLRLHEAIPGLLARKLPNMKYRITYTPFQTSALIIEEDQDPFAEARKMAAATGQDLYVDRTNTTVTQNRVVDATTKEVWHFQEGENADFWDTERSDNDDAFPNVVIVVGANPSFPNIRGRAEDTNAASETYVGLGERPVTLRSELVTSNDQANAMAKYYLSKKLGPQDEVTFSCSPNPALDPGDIIMLTCTRMGLDHTKMIVEDIDMANNTQEDMDVVCRRSIDTNAAGQLVRP